MLMVVGLTALMYAMARTWDAWRSLKRTQAKLSEELAERKIVQGLSPRKREERFRAKRAALMSELNERLDPKKGRRFSLTVLWSLTVLSVVCIAAVVVQIVVKGYVRDAIYHFEKSMTICAPYLSPYEEEMIRSRFAQIDSRSDYTLIISGLTKTATTHGLALSEFEVW